MNLIIPQNPRKSKQLEKQGEENSYFVRQYLPQWKNSKRQCYQKWKTALAFTTLFSIPGINVKTVRSILDSKKATLPVMLPDSHSSLCFSRQQFKSWMIFLSPSFFGMINTLFLLWSLYVMRQIILLWRYCFRLIGILKWFYISLIFSFVATVSHTQFVILEGFRFVDWENLGGLSKGSKQKLMMMGALDNFCYPFQAFYRWNEFLS